MLQYRFQSQYLIKIWVKIIISHKSKSNINKLVSNYSKFSLLTCIYGFENLFLEWNPNYYLPLPNLLAKQNIVYNLIKNLLLKQLLELLLILLFLKQCIKQLDNNIIKLLTQSHSYYTYLL